MGSASPAIRTAAAGKALRRGARRVTNKAVTATIQAARKNRLAGRTITEKPVTRLPRNRLIHHSLPPWICSCFSQNPAPRVIRLREMLSLRISAV
jgi:hypothetical protein